MDKEIKSIVQMFPDFEEKIDFLFQTDQNFRDLCSDHLLCAAMVQDIKDGLIDLPLELEEYEDLRRKLEQEILQMIKRQKYIP